MGIVYGLLAALLWGGGDVLINRLTQFIGTTRSLVLTQLLSLAFWIIYAGITGFPQGVGPEPWKIAAICGVFHVAGLVLTYRAFEIGTLSIVSPIASSFAIVTAVLAIAFDERPSNMAIAGAVMLVIGVVIVTRASSGNEKATLKGVPEALGSALAFGIMFWQIDHVAPVPLGMALPLVLLKLMASSYAVIVVLASKKKEAAMVRESSSRREVWLLASGVALSDSLAWVAFILGTKTSFTSVVTALASLFSVVTVVLAAFILKERLNKPQYVGIAAVFAGIILVSL